MPRRRLTVAMLWALSPWTLLRAQDAWRNWLPVDVDRLSGICEIMAVEVADHPLLPAIAAVDLVRLGDEGREFQLLSRYVGIRFRLIRAASFLGIPEDAASSRILHLYSQWRLHGSCVLNGKAVDVTAPFPERTMVKPPIAELDQPVETFGPEPSPR